MYPENPVWIHDEDAPFYLNSTSMFGKINYSEAAKKRKNERDDVDNTKTDKHEAIDESDALDPHDYCETIEQVIHRYTDGYDEWCDATNDITDVECLGIATSDMQLLIEELKAKHE